MTARAPRAIEAATFVIALIAASATSGCHTQRDAFCKTVFPCNAAGPSDQCGNTCAGRPMTCFPGSKLSGEDDDFCAEACDPAAPVADPVHFACLDSGALVQICHPSADASGATGDREFLCPEGLSCYRTDLLNDVGLCLHMRVCSQNTDCTGPHRSTCASTVVRAFESTQVLTDHLQCLQYPCRSGSDCSDGDNCLGGFIDHGPVVNALCVPSCDPALRCPPNFACARNLVAAPGAPAICEPGVLGVRCSHDQDCIIGTCADIGLEFDVCALPLTCATDSDCAPLDNSSDLFVCVGGPPGVCTSLSVFHGVDCVDVDESTDCPPGLRCFAYSPYTPIQKHGECRVPCGTDGACPERGHIPHVCLGAHHEGGCFPGRFGMPCTDSTQCLAGLACEDVPADPRSLSSAYSAAICTIPCATDGDCVASRLTVKSDSYCSCGPGVVDAPDGSCRQGMGFCRLGGWDGSPCDRNAQCSSNNCNTVMGACVAALMN